MSWATLASIFYPKIMFFISQDDVYFEFLLWPVINYPWTFKRRSRWVPIIDNNWNYFRIPVETIVRIGCVLFSAHRMQISGFLLFVLLFPIATFPYCSYSLSHSWWSFIFCTKNHMPASKDSFYARKKPSLSSHIMFLRSTLFTTSQILQLYQTLEMETSLDIFYFI